MARQQAIHSFSGEQRNRHNCAQALARGFQEECSVSEETIASLKACGGGHAPEGLCGALYAAILLRPDKAKQLRAAFAAAAGSETCREIKSQRLYTCRACVEKAAELLEKEL